MVQKYFTKSWLLPCSLRLHRTAYPTPKNGLRHFSALPAHHPKIQASKKTKTTTDFWGNLHNFAKKIDDNKFVTI